MQRENEDDIEMHSQSEDEDDEISMIGEELNSVKDCLEWLQSIGYGHYVSDLQQQWIEDKMDGETLKMLNQSDLV